MPQEANCTLLKNIWKLSDDISGHPFSFVYGGRHSRAFLADWECDCTETACGEDKTEHRVTFAERDGPLVVTAEITEYRDAPAVEWVLRFSNRSDVSTDLLEDVYAVDCSFPQPGHIKPVLSTLQAGACYATDFAPREDVLQTAHVRKLQCSGGRSADGDPVGDGYGVMPVFDLTFRNYTELLGHDEGTLVCSVGWSGQWQALVRHAESALSIKACMPGTHLRLLAREAIRTPKMLFFYGEEQPEDVRRQFRRFMFERKTPRINGELPQLPISASCWLTYNFGNDVSEANQIEFIDFIVNSEIGLDTYWLDAGWMEGTGGWAGDVGNWTPKARNFPNGLAPIGKHARDNGMGFVLWFEPERVCPGTWLHDNHPDWLIPPASGTAGDRPESLLDLGNPDARQWLTEHISDMIETCGITIYRQDCNFDPLPYWKSADTDDRRGIAQIRHIEGLYAFWDELRRRHPDVLIDNCAQGARRLDLETCARSIVTWRSDYRCDPDALQSHNVGLNRYFPTHGTAYRTPDLYATRSSYSTDLNLDVPIESEDLDIETYRRIVSEYRGIRPLFMGDFYPLTSHSTAHDVWCAYEYYREDLHAGCALFFRREASPHGSGAFNLYVPDESKAYRIENVDTAEVMEIKGSGLTRGHGVQITLAQRESCLLLITETADG